MSEEQVQQENVAPEQTPANAENQQAEAAEVHGESQQESEGKEHPSGEQPRDEQGKFKPKVQQRIDEITRARHEAEREAAYWRERAMAGTSDKAQSNSAQEPPQKPSVDQFQDYAEYVEALADWKADQKVREALSARDAERAAEADKRAQQSKAEAWAERQESARAAMPDYDEVVGLSDIQVAQHVAETLIDSEVGPAIAYQLAKDPALAEKINAMSPLAAAREIGRIEASLLNKPAAPAVPVKQVSKAPAPISPIGSGKTNATNDPAQMTNDQYREWRAKQGARWAK